MPPPRRKSNKPKDETATEAPKNIRVAKYGVVLESNQDVISDLMYKVFLYKNVLIANERNRRVAVDQLNQATFPDFAAANEKWEAAKAAREAIDAEIKATSAKNRKRTPPTKEQKAQLAACTAAVSAAYKPVKEMKAVIFADVNHRAALQTIDDEYLVKDKAARAASGLHWGSYLGAETDLKDRRKGAPPKFREWRGDSKLGIQIQKGVTPEGLFNPKNTLIRATKTDHPDYVKFQMRIGTIEGTRKPIWVDLGMKMNKPLPEGARIVWCTLTVRRYADANRYYVSLTLHLPEIVRRPDLATGHSRAGVEVGWRKIGDRVRIACVKGDNDEPIQEYWLDNRTIEEDNKVRDMESVMKTDFNAMCVHVGNWIKNTPACDDWLKAECITIRSWQSLDSLRKLFLLWETKRIAGDESVFAALREWWRRDLHLFRYSANLRRKSRRNRDQNHRLFVIQTCQKYAHIVVEAIDWADFRKKLGLKEEANSLAGVSDEDWRKRYRDVAAVGKLVELFGQYAARLTKHAPEYTTIRCHSCGEIAENFSPALDLEHTCEHCGTHWDQDHNAAINLWSAGSATDPDAGTKDPDEPDGDTGESCSRVRGLLAVQASLV